MNSTEAIQCIVSSNPQWIPLLIGGAIAILGGFTANIAKLRLENSQEIKCIKTNLIDEITEISKTIEKMLETQEASEDKILNKKYFNYILRDTESFDSHKNRLFLISDDDIRNNLRKFYNNLTIKTNEYINSTVTGTLNKEDKEQATEVTEAINKFKEIKNKADDLVKNIKNYKYKPFWLF